MKQSMDIKNQDIIVSTGAVGESADAREHMRFIGARNIPTACRAFIGLPSNESETFIFLLDICGSHHKPLHVTVGIIIWLWLTVCHGKIHHAIKFAKASISMGLFFTMANC